jgi:cytochrome c-type biogenesis protein CcmH/NrfG
MAVPPPTLDAETVEQSFEEMLAEVTPGTHRESLAKSGSGRARTSSTPDTTTAATDAPRRGNGRSLRGLAMVGLAVVGIVAVAFTGYQLGAAPSTAADLQASPAPQASPALDQALIADLMTKVAADPKDVNTMLQLGDAFYRGEDFGAAVTWFGKALDVDGTSTRARLALGAAYFNLGDMAGAETAWLAVVKQDPDNVEAHYDLGFLFLNRDPADMDGVRREWGEVVRLAPDSDVAKTVKAHLDALSSPAPSVAPGTAPSTAPSAAPSGVPSATPSAAPVQP